MNGCIGVYENSFRREPLCAVAGHGVSMVEVPVSLSVKLDL